MQKLKWLYPGMLIKRWIFFTTIGVFLISMGFTVVISEQFATSRTFGSIIVFIGIICVISGIKRMIRSFISVLLPNEDERLVDRFFSRRVLAKGIKVVAIGGGHGLSTLLQGLKRYTNNITAIVTVADDGGSSGRLREEFDVLPPGDIRNCLVALANETALLGDLFQFRFKEGGQALKGHNFGNLFITAMTRVTGDFEKAIKESSKVLAIRGKVVPSTTAKVILSAQYKDGSVIRGESKIPEKQIPIERMFIEPEDCIPTDDAITAIREADVIVIGPGSLYTSIMPNLLIKGLAKEIQKSKVKKIYICNVMTQPGETDNYTLSDPLDAIIKHTAEGLIDYVVVNNQNVPNSLLEKYEKEGAYPVKKDKEEIKKLGVKIVTANIINSQDYIRHNPKRLAKIILDIVSSVF
jgi:uncharacterized cofD-like protein